MWWRVQRRRAQRRMAAGLRRSLAVLALLGQLLVPIAAIGEPVAAGETVVVCTPQGLRSISLDPAVPDQHGTGHRCDVCCLGPCRGALLPAGLAATFPLGGAAHLVGPWPATAPPAGTPRYARPQGRAPPSDLA